MIEILPNWHPVFVHFTVALLTTSAGLFLVGRFAGGRKWGITALKVAPVNLWIGAIATIATVVAGFHAYGTVDHDTPSHLAMKDHRNWALVTATAFLVLAAWSWVTRRKPVTVGAPFLAVMLLATGALGATAWRGGELVYRHGLGVMALPETRGDHDHNAHEHGGGQEAPATQMTAPAHDDGHDHGAHANNMGAQGVSSTTGTGTIHNVSRMNRRINLTHAPIPALGWPEMTMNLDVAEGVDLKDIGTGDSVSFQLQLGDDKVYRITRISKAHAPSQDADHGDHEH